MEQSLIKNKVTTLDYYMSKLIVATARHHSIVKDIEEEMKDTVRVRDLDISVRLSNGLDFHKVITLRDLLNLNERRMQEMRNIGKKSMTELIELISKIGYYRPFYGRYLGTRQVY